MKIGVAWLASLFLSGQLAACAQCGNEPGNAAVFGTDTGRSETSATPPHPAKSPKAPGGPDINTQSMLLEEVTDGNGVSGIRFGPTGNHVAWIRSLATDRKHVVLDGRPGPEYIELTAPKWSRDGIQYVYAGNARNTVVPFAEGQMVGKQWFVEVGTERFGPYQNADEIRVANDGSVSWRATLKALPKSSPASNQAMFIDGVADPTFRAVPRKGAAYDANGRLVAYRAQSGAGWHVVTAGKAGAAYDRVGVPSVSPNGKHIAYAAGASGKKNVDIVVDTKPYDTSFSDFSSLSVSDSGVASGVGQRTMLVPNIADKSTWRRVDEVPWIMARGDGTSYAYRKGTKTTLVLDGARTPLPADVEIGTVVPSPRMSDGKTRWIATSRKAGKGGILVDGQAWPSGGTLEATTWSWDGRRLAYRLKASATDKPSTSKKPEKPVRPSKVIRVVVDKAVYGPFAVATAPFFAPHTSRIAFSAKRAGEDFHLWLDGVEDPKTILNPLRPLRWSPDGQRLARAIVGGGRHRWVVGKRRSAPLDNVFDGRFSHDGTRFGAGIRDGSELRWWVLSL